jgi:hypothetical protein
MKPIHFAVSLLLLSVAGNIYLAMQIRARAPTDYRTRYTDMRSRYVSLAKSQKNLMEVVIKTSELKGEMARVFPGSYTNLTDEAFQEACTRKIVRLEMEAKDLEKE